MNVDLDVLRTAMTWIEAGHAVTLATVVRTWGSDLDEDALARLHGPVGLRIDSRTPPEIALAILAEMTAVKNGAAAPLVNAG